MPTPVKVFGPPGFANVSRVLVFLEEIGAEYEVVDVNVPAGEHKIPDHLARNVTSISAPSLKFSLRDGDDLVLFESRAIAKYILRKYRTNDVDLLREGNLKEATMVDMWTEVEAHQYSPALMPIVYECLIFPRLRGTPTNQKVVDESVEKLKKVLEVYDARLSKNEYLAGDFISYADLSHFSYTLYFMATPYASVFDSYPHVKAWWEKLMSRPSIKKLTANVPKKF